jgi:hypothetical protein
MWFCFGKLLRHAEGWGLCSELFCLNCTFASVPCSLSYSCHISSFLFNKILYLIKIEKENLKTNLNIALKSCSCKYVFKYDLDDLFGGRGILYKLLVLLRFDLCLSCFVCICMNVSVGLHTPIHRKLVFIGVFKFFLFMNLFLSPLTTSDRRPHNTPMNHWLALLNLF